ncbi:MAG: murein biosynthesis integral membrane protein MurJ, partial [Planctomycetes bacterium]|nr:murein biosynthesis integral membrane protein MurJ [Planctomycetota bacterium]
MEKDRNQVAATWFLAFRGVIHARWDNTTCENRGRHRTRTRRLRRSITRTSASSMTILEGGLMPERSGFLGHARTIGLCTMLSRVLGMVRDILCAALFGTHWVWDAFSFAFRAPNLFRRLFGEGAMSGAFIPVFTEYLETKPREEAWLMLGKVFTALLTALLSIVLIGELAFIVAPFLHEFQPTGSLALRLLLVMFPYLLFICLVALAMGILNSLGHFFMPAFSPAMLNVCWIAAIGFVYFGPQMTPERKVFVLALAILFAGVVQLAMQVPVLRKLGVPIRLDFRFDHPAVRQVARLWAPVVFGMGIVQLNVLMDGLIAIGFSHQPGGPDSFSLFGLTIRYPMQEGANSTLYFAERLYQLPLSVLGTAMATAVLPTFSRHFARGDHEGLAATLSLALRVIFFVGVPASVAIMVLSEPMVDLLFKRGKFTEQSVERTAMVV